MFAGLVLAAIGMGASAQTPAPVGRVPQQVFAVSDILVDRTAASATAARADAIEDAARQGFQRLVRRLALSAAAERVPVPPAAQLLDLVRGFEVTDEKTSAVRYIARYTVRFKPDAVRALLRGAGVPFAESLSRPVVVLPVFETNQDRVLWTEPNPWRAAWQARPARDGLVAFVLPVGDLPDVSAIAADQAAAGDGARLRAVGQRYGGGETIVTVAKAVAEGGGADLAVQVLTTRHAPAGPQATVERLRAGPGESLAALLARAADGVAAQAEERWKQENIFTAGREQALEAVVPLRSLKDWVAIRARLGRAPPIRRTEVLDLSRGEVRVRLHFVGEEGQLANALAQQDLRLDGQGAARVLMFAGTP